MTSHVWDKGFDEIKEDVAYYPGSSKAIVRHPNRSEGPRRQSNAVDETWDDKPRRYTVGGAEREFFTVGHLAKALGREPVTIRKWERLGIIPLATFETTGKDSDPRGRRRLYSREQVEGIVSIAAEEGMFTNRRKPFDQTAFRQRVLDLFKSLAAPNERDTSS